MARGIYVVLTSPVSAAEDHAFNLWYDRVHLPQVLEIDGILSARRFKVASVQTQSDASLGSDDQYLVLYELDGDFEALAREIAGRSADGTFIRTDTMRLDPLPRAVFYEETGWYSDSDVI